MSNEKRQIKYWRLMPKGSIVPVEVVCEVTKNQRSDGTPYEEFKDSHGNYHYLGPWHKNYPTLESAIKAAKKGIEKAEANARATLLSCEIRRIRLEESLRGFALEKES